MKKLVLCAILLAATAVTAVAQEKATFGVRAGMNISNLSVKLDGESVTSDSRIGYNLGFSYQLPVVSKLFLETGLNLSTRGAKVNGGFTGETEDSDLKINMLYVQLPVAISWHFDLNKVSLQPFVGVYYGLGVSGKMKAGDQKMDLFKEIKIEEDVEPQMLKRSDFGVRFGVGAAFCQKYYVSVGYDLGMSNLLKDKELASEAKFKNGNLFISVGYNF